MEYISNLTGQYIVIPETSVKEAETVEAPVEEQQQEDTSVFEAPENYNYQEEGYTFSHQEESYIEPELVEAGYSAEPIEESYEPIAPIGANVETIRSEFEQTKKEQGFIGNLWDSLKNAIGMNTGSAHVEQVIKDAQEGKVSLDEAKMQLQEYQEGQKEAVENASDIGAGLLGAAAIAGTGGVSLLGGLAIAAVTGAAGKSAIKAADAYSGDREYTTLTRDLQVGAADGSIGRIAAPIGNLAGAAIPKAAALAGNIASGTTFGLLDGAARAQIDNQDIFEHAATSGAIGGAFGGSSFFIGKLTQAAVPIIKNAAAESLMSKGTKTDIPSAATKPITPEKTLPGDASKKGKKQQGKQNNPPSLFQIYNLAEAQRTTAENGARVIESNKAILTIDNGAFTVETLNSNSKTIYDISGTDISGTDLSDDSAVNTLLQELTVGKLREYSRTEITQTDDTLSKAFFEANGKTAIKTEEYTRDGKKIKKLTELDTTREPALYIEKEFAEDGETLIGYRTLTKDKKPLNAVIDLNKGQKTGQVQEQYDQYNTSKKPITSIKYVDGKITEIHNTEKDISFDFTSENGTFGLSENNNITFTPNKENSPFGNFSGYFEIDRTTEKIYAVMDDLQFNGIKLPQGTKVAFDKKHKCFELESIDKNALSELRTEYIEQIKTSQEFQNLPKEKQDLINTILQTCKPQEDEAATQISQKIAKCEGLIKTLETAEVKIISDVSEIGIPESITLENPKIIYCAEYDNGIKNYYAENGQLVLSHSEKSSRWQSYNNSNGFSTFDKNGTLIDSSTDGRFVKSAKNIKLYDKSSGDQKSARIYVQQQTVQAEPKAKNALFASLNAKENPLITNDEFIEASKSSKIANMTEFLNNYVKTNSGSDLNTLIRNALNEGQVTLNIARTEGGQFVFSVNSIKPEDSEFAKLFETERTSLAEKTNIFNGQCAETNLFAFSRQNGINLTGATLYDISAKLNETGGLIFTSFPPCTTCNRNTSLQGIKIAN